MSERVYSESSKERKHFPETKKRKQREPGKYFAKQRKKSTKNTFQNKEKEPGKHFQRQRKRTRKTLSKTKKKEHKKQNTENSNCAQKPHKQNISKTL